MELGMDVEKLKEVFTLQHLKRSFLRLIFKFGSFIIFSLIIIITAYLICFWYSHVYNPTWDELKKQEYIRNKEKGVVFDKTNFENVIKETEAREEEFQNKLENIEDIFRLKK